jgi:hypothetical protein
MHVRFIGPTFGPILMYKVFNGNAHLSIHILSLYVSTWLLIIYCDAGGVPISFPLGNDEVALVTSIRLSLRFQMSEDFIFIDKEVYDAQSGDLIHTIGQSLVYDGNTKQWFLNVGRYRVYGVSDSVMAASTELVTPH